MPTPQEIFDKRDKFLEKREAVLNRKVAAAERKLLDEIVDQFLDRLETSKGVIVNNGENIELTQAIDLIFAKFWQYFNKKKVYFLIPKLDRSWLVQKSKKCRKSWKFLAFWP